MIAPAYDDALRIAQDKVNPKNYYAYNPEFDGP